MFWPCAGENLQDLVHDVALGSFDALQTHQVMQVDGAVGQALAGHNFLAVLYSELLEAGDFVAHDALLGRLMMTTALSVTSALPAIGATRVRYRLPVAR